MYSGSDPRSLSPSHLLILLREWKTIVAGAIVCMFLAAAAYVAGPKTFESSATVLVYSPFFKISGSQGASRVSARIGSPYFRPKISRSSCRRCFP